MLPARDGLVAAGLGWVTVLYTWSLLSAIEILPVPLAILVFYLFPVFTTFIVAMMGWERLKRINIIAAFVAFAGLALALGVSGGGLNLLGVAYAAVAALGLALVSAVSSCVIRSGDPWQATLYMAATAALTFVLITILFGEFRLPTTETGWWGFIDTNLVYAAAMIGYFVAISMIGPGKTTLYSNIEPLIAIGAAFILLDQVLSPLQILGVVVVVGALALCFRRIIFSIFASLRSDYALDWSRRKIAVQPPFHRIAGTKAVDRKREVVNIREQHQIRGLFGVGEELQRLIRRRHGIIGRMKQQARAR